MPKVSVIVPIYGVEKYIERCARSLFEQTLDDMEFIFVDDCTKDFSIDILERVIEDYPNRKEQVRILHHDVNKGLSHARETGVKASTGDYIGHCDSDDWVDEDMYKIMYESARKGSYDYIKCGHRKTDGDKTIAEIHAYYEPIMTQEIIRKYIIQFNGWNSIWDTLVSRSVYMLADPIYTDCAMLEDFYLSSQLLVRARSVGYIKRCFYNYYVNPDSICGSATVNAVVNKALQARKNVEDILNILKNRYNIYYTNIELVHIKWLVKNILVPVMDVPETRDCWNSIYPELRYGLLLDRTISWRNKARFYVSELNLYKFFKRRWIA